jgi:hypothetical protein
MKVEAEGFQNHLRTSQLAPFMILGAATAKDHDGGHSDNHSDPNYVEYESRT